MLRSCPFFIVMSVALWPGACGAFDIRHSATTYKDRRYQCELTVELDAPIDRIEAILRDYENYPELDSRILKARVVERPQTNVAILATTLRVCLGWFCRNVDRIERVEESAHALVARADPGRSDVRFGETHLQLSPGEHGGTLVRYSTSITPGFWMPAVVGRRWMLRTLQAATEDLFMNVEMKAKGARGEERVREGSG